MTDFKSPFENILATRGYFGTAMNRITQIGEFDRIRFVYYTNHTIVQLKLNIYWENRISSNWLGTPELAQTYFSLKEPVSGGMVVWFPLPRDVSFKPFWKHYSGKRKRQHLIRLQKVNYECGNCIGSTICMFKVLFQKKIFWFGIWKMAGNHFASF